MKFIKIIGIIISGLLLITIISIIAWALKIDPEVFSVIAIFLGMAIGLTAFVFIVDELESK